MNLPLHKPIHNQIQSSNILSQIVSLKTREFLCKWTRLNTQKMIRSFTILNISNRSIWNPSLNESFAVLNSFKCVVRMAQRLGNHIKCFPLSSHSGIILTEWLTSIYHNDTATVKAMDKGATELDLAETKSNACGGVYADQRSVFLPSKWL